MADTMEDAQDKYEQNAADALGELFSRYGLGSLAPKIVELVQEYGPENTNTILLQLQETEEYKARFVGNEYRKQAGYSVLSPAEYIALESSYREVMRRAGLPEGFYDQQGDFNQLVGRDISPAELASRAQAAVDWSLNIDETQKKALLAYDINHGDLAAYFLDYDRGLPLLQAKFDKALLAAERARFGAEIDKQFADELFSAGRTVEQVREGYGRIGLEVDTNDKLGDVWGEDYTLRDAERAELLADSGAKNKERRLRSRERAAFAGSAGTRGSSLASDDKFS